MADTEKDVIERMKEREGKVLLTGVTLTGFPPEMAARLKAAMEKANIKTEIVLTETKSNPK